MKNFLRKIVHSAMARGRKPLVLQGFCGVERDGMLLCKLRLV